MEDVVIGFIVGLLGLLLPNLRIINMLQGNTAKVVFFHILASLCWVVGINKIANSDVTFIISNIVGGTIAMIYLTKKQKVRNGSK